MTRLRYVVLAPALILAGMAGPVGVTAARAPERTIYVSVMDSNGGPVADMKPEEFSVKEDGADRAITTVERASEPIHYVIMGPARTNLGNVLRSIAANSFQQYAVTYAPGDPAKPAKITDVAVSRQGVLAMSMKWNR